MHYNISPWIIHITMLLMYAVKWTESTTPPTTTAKVTKATTLTSHSKQYGAIRDISAIVVPYENEKKVLQLLVDWKDNLAESTSYNVIVTPVNATACSDPPCSVYGVRKSIGPLLIPANPMTNIEPAECNYMFGCNYTLIVETSNAAIYHKKHIEIPYCVMDECSCQHEHFMPKIIMNANIPKNDTIDFNWSIKIDDEQSSSWRNVWKDNEINKIHLKISEQTNPSLTWGGNQIPINDEVYNISDVSYTKSDGMLRGTMLVKLKQQMAAKVMLNLHAYVIDELGCQGPANFINVQVPEINELLTTDRDLLVSLIIVTILFFLALIGVLVFCLWVKHKKKLKAELEKEEQYMSPFATAVEMEDNIIYVDKYIEASQAKGLADTFEVPHHSLQIGPEIGEGAFGRVYKAIAVNLRGIRGSTLVAVKQLKKNPTADEVEEFLSEIKMLKGVGTHNNIVCFLGCCTIRPPYLMIMEYVGRGDLLSYLRTVRNENSKFKSKDANCNGQLSNGKAQPVPQPTVKYIELKISTQSTDSEAESERRQPKPSFAETTYTIVNDEDYHDKFEYILDHKELHYFALQIANGMRFLEQQEITHRDLAARNVLIDDRKTLKISDFGLSRHGIYTNTKIRKLPLRWLSIEAIRDNIYSNKSDVWAYGVVLWEIGTLGASPYQTISNHELIPYLLEGKRLEKPEICTEQVYALMLQCWDEDPKNRPTFEELYNALSPRTAYVDISSLSDDYVFPPIKE